MNSLEGKSIASCIRELFQERHDGLVNDESRKILVSHYGKFSQELVGSLSNSVEELLISIGDKKIVIKRMFSILLEGLQNIRIHGGVDSEGNQVGYLIIASQQYSYKILMANIIDPEHREKVESYLDEINEMSQDDLKEKYVSILSNEFLSQKGGAGLGIIITRIKAGKLGYSFDSLCDDSMLFSLEITLPR